MKTIIVIIFFNLLAIMGVSQTIDSDKYLNFYNDMSTASYYKMGSSAYLDYYLSDKIIKGDHEYYTRIRKYSWGDSDTAYFRQDSNNFYHYDAKIDRESIVLPKKIEMGQKWFEADSSWSYEVIGIHESLVTPDKKYKDLIVVECKQLTDRDEQKSKAYHMYYAKGLGMVGSMNDGKLTSYLAEVKKNAKDGDKVGTK